jgi:uncharacterized protein YceK
MRSLLGRRKAFLLVAALAALFAVLATGCGSSNKNKSTSSAASTASTPAATTPSSKGKTYTVGIDIPFHPIFDYVEAKSKDYFGPKGYTVKFKVLDATTQVPSFGKGDLDVMTTPPSFIPRVKDSYGIDAAEDALRLRGGRHPGRHGSEHP